jgi:hypothetical protein
VPILLFQKLVLDGLLFVLRAYEAVGDATPLRRITFVGAVTEAPDASF